MQLVCDALGIRVTIANAVVHGGQPCRVQVAKPRHLNRGRMQGENAETVPIRVARQIHEYVDLVASNLLCEETVADSGDLMPPVD